MSRQPEEMDVDQRPEEEGAPTAPPNKDQEEEETAAGVLFSCRCESARSVSTLLSCLKNVGTASNNNEESFGHATPITVFCSPTCLTFHVSGKSRQCQASVDMQAGLFSDYRVLRRNEQQQRDNVSHNDATNKNDDDWQAGGEFCVNLVTVLECLHVLGANNNGVSDTTSSPLCLSYDLDTEIFRMELLDESGVLSTAALPGVVPSPTDSNSSLALAFRSTPIVARMICNSQTLKEAMHELDLVHGATCCTVAISDQQGLELACVGDSGECLVFLPASSTLLLESQSIKAQTYPLQSLRSGMRAVDIAQETCVSINEAGMMAIQHQVLDHVGTGQPNFVDFIMACLQEEEDENGETENEGIAPAASQDSHTTTPHLSLASQRSQDPSSMAWNDDTTQPDPPQDRVDPSQDHMEPSEDRAEPRQDRVEPSRTNHDDDKGDDSDDDSLPPPAPASSAVESLFGTVVVGRTSGTSQVVRRKRTARPRSSSSRTATSSMGEQDDDDDDNSDSLLPEPQAPLLDITAPARSTRRRRIDDDDNDGSSSPEIGYGPEMTQDEF